VRVSSKRATSWKEITNEGHRPASKHVPRPPTHTPPKRAQTAGRRPFRAIAAPASSSSHLILLPRSLFAHFTLHTTASHTIISVWHCRSLSSASSTRLPQSFTAPIESIIKIHPRNGSNLHFLQNLKPHSLPWLFSLYSKSATPPCQISTTTLRTQSSLGLYLTDQEQH